MKEFDKDYMNKRIQGFMDSRIEEGYVSEYDLEQLIGLCQQASHYEANKGYRHERIEQNEREKAFYEQWMIENEPSPGINNGHGILQDLFIERKDFGRKFVEFINERDRYIVATIIQWLGTNVGMSFLHEALRRFGATITYDKKIN